MSEHIDYKHDEHTSDLMIKFYETVKSPECDCFITSQSDVEEYMRFMHLLSDETPHVLYLDNRNRVITTRSFEGTVDHCTIYPRKIFHEAMNVGAATFILTHNHPGGSSSPSEADWKITERLKVIGTALDITLMDHIIFYGTGVTSMRGLGRWGQ